MMFLGCTSGLFSWVVSCWLLHLLIKGSLLLTIVRTGHSVPLIKGIFSAFGFCNGVLREKVISPQPNSKPRGPKSSLYPLTCLAWVTLPGVKDSSRHSSMDVSTRHAIKPLNHGKVVVPLFPV